MYYNDYFFHFFRNWLIQNLFLQQILIGCQDSPPLSAPATMSRRPGGPLRPFSPLLSPISKFSNFSNFDRTSKLCTAAPSHTRHEVRTVVHSTDEVRVTTRVSSLPTVPLSVVTRARRLAVLQLRDIVRWIRWVEASF